MINLRGFAVATEGNLRRLVITYDTINENGDITNRNKKVNKIITNENILNNVSAIEEFINTIIEE